jgi:outer membrane protein insertion porin family
LENKKIIGILSNKLAPLKFLLRAIFIFCCLFFSLSFSGLFAQNSSSKELISGVSVEGLNKASRRQILNITRSLIDQELKEILIINRIKQLYALGFFEDISVQRKEKNKGEVELIFSFIEKPTIQRIIFEGNSRLDNKKLEEALSTKVQDFVDIASIQNDLAAMKALYVKEGYNLARIIYRLEALEQEKTNLVFQILENDKVYVTKINITGSQFFLPIDIERMMQTAEIDCFSWITESGKLNQEKISIDLGIITQAYLKEGFIDMEIAKPKIKLIFSKNFIVAEVSLDIEEGEQFFVGDIFLESLDKDKDLLFSDEQLREVMKLEKGDVYNLLQQNQDRVALNNLYQDAGYAFSSVVIRRNVDREKLVVHSVFQIQRREKVYINRIEFAGNQETRDDIIRRELTIYDGELFNGKKIRESRSRISGLGYFAPGAGVRLQRETQRSQNVLNYRFDLEEIQTGNFSGGLSYSDNGGFGANLSVTKSNFLGTGRRIGFKYEQGENNRLTELSFTEPYLFSSRWRSTTSLSLAFTGEDGSNLDYDRQVSKASQSFSYPIWKNWRTSIGYGYEETTRSNFNEDATSVASLSVTRFLTNGYSYSTVNNPFFPSDGVLHSISARQTGGELGGDEHYRRLTYEYKYFQNVLSDRTIFYYRLRLRKLFQIFPEELIPVSNRFVLGGATTVRGFRNFEIKGPASPNEWPADFLPESLEGDNREYYLNHRNGIEEILSNIELSFPLSRTGQNLRGVVFYDLGNVFAEDRMYEIVGLEKDYTYLRRSYGTGVRIITPLGVFKFDYGIKANIRGNESSSLFEFTIGSLF